MRSFNNITIQKELYSGKKSIVYRGIKNGSSVIVKYLINEYPTKEEIDFCQREFDLLKNLNSPYIVKVKSIEKFQNNIVLIFEDITGQSIFEIIQKNEKIPIIQFFKITNLLLEGLKYLQDNNVVHRDIKPHNIIFNEKANRLQIIDFGLAKIINDDRVLIERKDNLEGTISYISPEQTGRMNRLVDYRTDFYSLGVTFYQMLTGLLPYNTLNQLELIHCHIAIDPIPIVEYGIPLVLSKIVNKLMSKNPEDRYQSIDGLINDFKEIQNQIDFKQTEKKIIKQLKQLDFPIGKNDSSGRFLIPEMLYGRGKESLKLFNAFKKVCRGEVKTLVISGDSGVGKTAFINEINKPLVEYKGFFISSKIDNMSGKIPFSSLQSALRDLIHQLLSQPEEEIAIFKQEVLSVINKNEGILNDFIPEFELIIGKFKTYEKYGIAERQIIFQKLIINFFEKFSNKNHPIVFYLDDFQWVDSYTLQIVRELITNKKISHLMILICYRTNFQESNAIDLFLNEIKLSEPEIIQLHLNPLKVDDINRLVSDTLKTDLSKTEALSNVLHQKTFGNPLILKELLNTLYTKKLIFYKNGFWNWDLMLIESESFSVNLVDHILAKIKQISDNYYETLRFLSCIGISFSLAYTKIIYNKYYENFDDHFYFLQQKGFFIIRENLYIFVHERLREAVYSSCAEELKVEYHTKIGIGLLDIVKNNNNLKKELLFNIVNQLNFGLTFKKSQVLHIDELINLNIEAADTSYLQSSTNDSLNYYLVVKKLLSYTKKKRDISVLFDVYLKISNLYYIKKKFKIANKYYFLLNKFSVNPIDKRRIKESQISLLVQNNSFNESYQLSLSLLNELNISIPEKEDIKQYYLYIQNFLKNNSIETLLKESQQNIKSEIKMVLKVLPYTILAAYHVESERLEGLILLITKISIENFSTGQSLLALILYASLLLSKNIDFKTGRNLAEKIISFESENQIEHKGMIKYIYTAMVSHWYFGFDESMKFFQSGLVRVNDNKNYIVLSLYLNHYYFNKFLSRKNLLIIYKDLNEYQVFINKISDLGSHKVFLLYLNLVNELTESNVPYENQDLKKLNLDFEQSLFVYNFSKSLVKFLSEDFDSAYEYSMKTKSYLNSIIGHSLIIENNFINSLILIYSYIQKFSLQNKTIKDNFYLDQIKENQIFLKNLTTEACEEYKVKYLLIKFSIAIIESDHNIVNISFQKILDIVSKYDLYFEEYIAHEMYSFYWENLNITHLFRSSIVESHYALEKWSCKIKLQKMEERYPFLKREIRENRVGRLRESDVNFSTSKYTQRLSITNNYSHNNLLDLNSVIVASQTMSEEIHLDKLLNRIMKILLEISGGENASYISVEKENSGNLLLTIEAQKKLKTNEPEVLKNKKINPTEIAETVINYVARTNKSVVLDNASIEGNFTKDLYIQKNNVKSLMCIPIINQSKIIGVIYIENNLSANAFSTDRIDLLNLLSTQIGISIKNAKLIKEVVSITNEKARISTAMEIAKDMQTCLIPSSPILNGYQLSTFMETCDEVGGDYYDIINDGDMDWMIIGDVSGHGVRSGMVMMMMQVAFHTAIKFYSPSMNLEDMLQRVNQLLTENINLMNAGKYISFTLFLKKNNTFYFSGLHLPILIYRDKLEDVEIISSEGSWLGYADVINDFPIQEFALELNDILILYTDGVTESRDKEDNMFLDTGLIKLLKKNNKKSTEEIKLELLKQLQSYENEDDITFMIVKRIE
jgi:histidine kinase